jgi:hypothetical protein
MIISNYVYTYIYIYIYICIDILIQVDIKPSNVDVISPKPIVITPGQFDASGCLIIDDDTEVDDEAWNKKQEECSFCKSFLQSPCRDPFKKWSKCVEKSKELDIEFVKACRIYTDRY